MGKIVDVENRDGVAILSVDNPLVKALSAAVRRVPLERVEVAIPRSRRWSSPAPGARPSAGRTSESSERRSSHSASIALVWVAAWKLP